MASPLDDGMLETAQYLVEMGNTRPPQPALRRAVSTAYYALFHTLCETVADKLVGGDNANRSDPAWNQVYRAINHGVAKVQCKKTYQSGNDYGFPDAVQSFAQQFSEMQENRHRADYDPSAVFQKQEVLLMIRQVRLAIEAFKAVKDKHKRAFAIWVLFKKRN